MTDVEKLKQKIEILEDVVRSFDKRIDKLILRLRVIEAKR